MARQLAAMISAAEGEGTRSVRDQAILALGLAAALRRWELVALERRDVEMVDNGLKLTLRHSKTDNEGQGQVIRMRKANGSAAANLLPWRDTK